MKKICIVTDAWHPQVNGVVTTLSNIIDVISKYDQTDIKIINPLLFKNYPLPFYKGIRFAIPIGFGKIVDKYRPDYIHIVTEGPIGVAAVIYCMKHGIPFTTSFHTDFSYYLKKHYFIPQALTWSYLKTFHWLSQSILVPSAYTRMMLHRKGFDNNIIEWSRGYNRNIFSHKDKRNVFDEKVYVCVSRVSKEKNLDDFGRLSLNHNGVFVLIGDGPYLNKMKKKYPSIIYCGMLSQEKIVEWFAKSDVFIFPSHFDTFGVAMLEALSCGVPVVCYNTGAASSMIINGVNGYKVDLFDDMSAAISKCEQIDRRKVSESVSSAKFSWERTAKIFLDTIVRIYE